MHVNEMKRLTKYHCSGYRGSLIGGENNDDDDDIVKSWVKSPSRFFLLLTCCCSTQSTCYRKSTKSCYQSALKKISISFFALCKSVWGKLSCHIKVIHPFVMTTYPRVTFQLPMMTMRVVKRPLFKVMMLEEIMSIQGSDLKDKYIDSHEDDIIIYHSQNLHPEICPRMWSNGRDDHLLIKSNSKSQQEVTSITTPQLMTQTTSQYTQQLVQPWLF